MIPLGLSGIDQQSFEEALVMSRLMRVRATILDRNEDPIDSLPGRILDGQVTYDTEADVTRVVSLLLMDPDRRLQFDSSSPADGALYSDRFLRVEYGVWVTGLEKWIDVPVFTGPVTRFSRDQAFVAVDAQGKETLGLAPALMWRSMTVPKGTKKTTAIRRIMSAIGERTFDIPDLGAKLPKPVSLPRNAEPWKVVQKIARGMNRQLMYDGSGKLRLRTIPETPVYTFRTGEGGDVTASPAVAYDVESVRNVVQVVGDAPRGGKKRIRYVAIADRSHPLSPYALARNGEPRFLVELMDESSVRSVAEARRVAERKLRSLLSQELQVAFESLAIPHLEEGDRVAVRTDEYSLAFELRQATLPLTAQANMAIGTAKRIQRPDRGRIR